MPKVAARLVLAAALLGAAPTKAQQALQWPPLAAVARGDAPLVRPFEELRYLRFLTEPLRAEGTLAVDAAGRLIKTVAAPVAEQMVVDGQQIAVERPPGQVVARLSLRSDPVAEAMIVAIRALLAADRRTLQNAFSTTVSGSERQWSLLLVPRDERVREAVATITIIGSGAALHGLELLETNGDRTVLALGGA